MKDDYFLESQNSKWKSPLSEGRKGKMGIRQNGNRPKEALIKFKGLKIYQLIHPLF
jgi:hypothetical protein